MTRLVEKGLLVLQGLPLSLESLDRKALLLAPSLWRSIPTSADRVLVFDDPTALCGNSPRSILDFVEYDWVGAAWKWAKPNSPHEWGGNGALSLRSRSMILRLLDAELADANKASGGAAGGLEATVNAAGGRGAGDERSTDKGALHVVTKANEDMWYVLPGPTLLPHPTDQSKLKIQPLPSLRMFMFLFHPTHPFCPPALPFRSRSRSHREHGIVRTGARGFSLVQSRQRPAVHAAVDDVGS